jgi:hypothetical protein
MAQLDTSLHTASSTWQDKYIPYMEFHCVENGQVKYSQQDLVSLIHLSPGMLITTVGLSLSTIDFNGYPNPHFTEGRFYLDVSKFSTYSDPRPVVTLLSQSGIEQCIYSLIDQDMYDENQSGCVEMYRAEDIIRYSGTTTSYTS